MGMIMKESNTAPTTLPPLLLRNLLASALIYAVNSFIFLSRKCQLFETFQFAFLFFLRFVPSSFVHSIFLPPVKSEQYDNPPTRNDSSIGRALSQILSIVNDIPVSSRKYQVVRSLAERIIDENHREGIHALLQVNCAVLSSAFATTLSHLEAAVVESERERGQRGVDGAGSWESGGPGEYRLNRVLRAVRDVGWRIRNGGGGEGSRSGISAEKLAAELLWLAQKLAACGCGREAVWRWAAASNLGWLALSAEPRLQASLVKLSAFLLKEAKDVNLDQTEGSKMEIQMQVKVKMLQSWLPLLCRGSNGTDTPVFSISERIELERVLEETIEGLEQEEDQEQVLSLWLHHFTHCPSSDWPNLHACYARWCSASRKQLLLQ